MSVFSDKHYNALGSIIDSTFGKTSIRDAGYGVKASIAGSSSDDEGTNPVLEVRFETLVNFNPRHGMQQQRKELDKTSVKMIDEQIGNIKKEFKEVFGSALKCSPIKNPEPMVEHISHNISLIRARYYRSVFYELSVS
jgi:hypothetical protein